MQRKHLIAGAVAVAAIAGGTAGAIAATSDEKAAESAVLADAAKRLGVSADELRSALSKAEDAQLDDAVKAGNLTQEQANEIKQHRQREGTVLGFGRGGPGPGPGFPGGPGFGHHFRGGPIEDAAKAIGISVDSLFSQLRDGKTLDAIAKAHGKTLADVRAAVKQATVDRLDADVKAGRLTKAQRDEIVDHLDEMLSHLGDMRFREHEHRGFGPPPGYHP